MKRIIDIPDGYVGVIMSNQRMEGSAMDKLIRQAIINGKPYEERPQGEWEEPFENNGKTYHKCNRCHISSELILIDRFCPSCGAYMWKGGAEE